jgi:hypothetical protein
MSNKNVYLKGKSRYIRPYHLDTGENLDDDSDIKAKLMRTGGVYSTMIVLPFDNRDDAEEHLNELGIPTDGMMGNLLKKITNEDGSKEIVYKVVRPHLEPNFEDPLMGPPKVINSDAGEWDPDTLIGNGSDITVKLNVWIGNKAKKVRWDALRVDNLVEYIPIDNQGGF